jgi:nicotinamide mononucleotide transporter
MGTLEILAVAFAVAYLLLVIRQNVLCWPAALTSVLLSLVVLFEARLYMDAALQVFYAAMAVYGWYQWMYGGAGHQGVSIATWSLRAHAATLVLILFLGLGLGALMSRTDAAFPYADALTSVAAIITTYMVAKKVLENWLYWFVIDAVSAYLYFARELFLFTGLFLFYLVLIVIGFQRWLREWQAQQAQVPAPAGAA